MKKYFLVFAAGLILASCGAGTGDQGQAVVESHTIETLASNPMDFEGKTVKFEGLIGHICHHSGDKMRIVQLDNDAFSMQVMLGDLMNQFKVEDEGREIAVTGVFKTVVRNLDALEAAEAHDHDHDHGHEDDHEHEDGHACSSTEEAIKRMAEKGIDPDIRPYVELLAFEIK